MSSPGCLDGPRSESSWDSNRSSKAPPLQNNSRRRLRTDSYFVVVEEGGLELGTEVITINNKYNGCPD